MSPLSRLIVILNVLILATFLADAIVIAVRSLINDQWTSTMLAYYTGVSWLAWALSLVLLLDETQKFAKWHWVQYMFWVVATLGDTVIGWLWAIGIYRANPDTLFTSYDHTLLAFFVIRFILEVSVVVFSIVHIFSSSSENATPLLTSEPRNSYGSVPPTDASCETSREKEPSAFANFFGKMRKLLPYIWPKKSLQLQVYVILCFALMLLGLAVSVALPNQIGVIVNNMGEGTGKFAWAAVLVYVGLRFLQGGSGLIQTVQNWLWIPIGQYTTREISVKMFAHLHGLSLDFHINRKTGEVLRVMDRGTSSIVQLLSQILFQIFPAIAQILVAVVYFTIAFSPVFGFIVFVTMAFYLFVTVAMTEWRTKFRRRMIDLDNFARTKAVDSLLNFETVKYYGAEGFEINRYKNAVLEYQVADWKSSVSLNLLNLAQNGVMSGGLLVGCLLAAYEVSEGRMKAGDFVTFVMYLMQLYTPLHWFGTYYRMIQANFIDMEKMLALFEEQQSVKDHPDAKDLAVKHGHIVFDNVTFAYDHRQTALSNISFSIAKGSTVALVGPSGGGKSTIMRLLFRFYDPLSGHIYIDGQDIRQVRQASLRKNIGVVPQDTVLFNDTILYNIRYGNVNANDDAVFRAAKAAQIHEKILSFPEGYDTKVGERGLRLSGGEKQRVAIARTMLKDPPIILLDEATSALDTTTERHIQQALSEITKDRTTLVIAHRLSTIVNADKILVCVLQMLRSKRLILFALTSSIKDGKVVESGSHDELIKQAVENGQQGVYYEMWQKQLRDENDTAIEEVTEGLRNNVVREEVAAQAVPSQTSDEAGEGKAEEKLVPKIDTNVPGESTQLVSSPTEVAEEPSTDSVEESQRPSDLPSIEAAEEAGSQTEQPSATKKATQTSSRNKKKKKKSKSKTTF
ncbi:Homocysteine S-methyltransferase 1 [Apophysomyces ossiformis]|uniref:ATP-binding cassette sub-family B member 6 n=1 Tax=Apophysomyces ossiformis TaxID=679940 RepID=A0A8H7EUA0_9FUNG|nr:Homocysteine S-methyltransferase 1 [Apophysomyces ossiformis]